MVHVSAATMANSLKRLERKGYIQRQSDEKDSRCNRIVITQKGLEAVERCPAAQENKNCRNYLDALDSYGKMLQTSTLIYNDTVSKFNQSIRPFPMNVAARLLHFQKKAYLEMR